MHDQRRQLRNIARSYAAAPPGTPEEVHLRIKLEQLVRNTVTDKDPQKQVSEELRRTAEELIRESERLREQAERLKKRADEIAKQVDARPK